jgi:hypothetical protein
MKKEMEWRIEEIKNNGNLFRERLIHGKEGEMVCCKC